MAGERDTRTARLQHLLRSAEATVLMEAHDGLSAKLAEEAGFEALWASGLSISAALGVRDSNEASWTQVLEVLEFMSDACELPILLDGDTGYGNFNNARRLVRKLEQRNIAGVCFEDKLFPKTNSFLGGRQELAAIDEFCGKLRAAKDTQGDPDFVVVARTEAFIAGWGVEEAVLRAHAYADSGADAVLVHSKREDASDIEAFVAQWRRDCPIVVVPTTYASVPLPALQALGVHNFIFANHALRSVIHALQHTLRTLRETSDLTSIEGEIAPLSEVFRLQNVAELQRSEARYLPTPDGQQETGAIILAASRGNFGELVEQRPKAMLQLGGKPILRWQVEALRRAGVRDISAVRGHAKAAMDLEGLRYFDNDEHADTGELWSLHCARESLQGPVIVAYGDVVYDDFILQSLLRAPGDELRIAADAAFRHRPRADTHPDLVRTSAPAGPLGHAPCELLQVGEGVARDAASGEWIGLLYVPAAQTAGLLRFLDGLAVEETSLLRHGSVPDLLNRLRELGRTVEVVHTYGHWYDLDDKRTLLAAENGVSR